jgi:hypothetical protein
MLGAFIKLRKVAVKFVMSAFACMEHLGFPLDEFSWNLIFEFFCKNLKRKFKFGKSEKSNSYCT